MKIGIDAREIKRPNTGTGMYVINLIKSLSEHDLENEYILFVDINEKLLFDLPKNFKYHYLKGSYFKKIQDQIIIPTALYFKNIDLYHVTHHNVTPYLTNVPLIVTVLDLAWIDFPGASSKLFQKYYYLISKYSLRKAKKIITISKSTKERVLFHFPYLSNKVNAILIACDPIFSLKSNKSDFTEIKKEFGIEKRFVLYVGSFATRKNVSTLIEAMKIYWSNKNNTTQLILAGKPSGKDDEILNDVLNRYPIKIISRSKTILELKALYENATVFVFPSLYEGFGLPVLEAMSCGCPVIASNSTSIPEILENHKLLFEPTHTNNLANMLQDLLNNSVLRSEISKKGLEESKKFTWEKVAKATIESYLF
jgi:glycosyltransferase involved in cell wall biosynthesis